tara:strand:- start:7248 stop:8432 length:1185 start_codon:yes stop_codon:yes gene_type:complete
MSLSKAIYKILSTETDLIAETSTRIFPSVIPQNVDYPALMYEINSQDPIYVKDRRHQKTEAHIVIGVHGKTYADVQNVSDIVIAALEKYKDATDYAAPETGISGTPDTGGCSIVEGYWVQEIFFDNSFDLFDEKLRVFEKYIEFDVRFLNNPSSMGAYGWFPVDITGLMSTSDSNTPPTNDGDFVQLFYDGSGSTTLNLEDEGGFDPDWYSGGYIRYRSGFESALGASSSKTFTNGNTMFFVFQTDVSASDYHLYLIHDNNNNFLKIERVSGTSRITVSINGNETILFSASENVLANKIYFAFSWGGSNSESGESEIIDPNSSTYKNKNEYTSFSDTGAGDFVFQYLGSKVAGNPTNVDTNVRIFESIFFDKKLTFGGGQYNRIKDYLLNKHSL